MTRGGFPGSGSGWWGSSGAVPGSVTTQRRTQILPGSATILVGWPPLTFTRSAPDHDQHMESVGGMLCRVSRPVARSASRGQAAPTGRRSLPWPAPRQRDGEPSPGGINRRFRLEPLASRCVPSNVTCRRLSRSEPTGPGSGATSVSDPGHCPIPCRTCHHPHHFRLIHRPSPATSPSNRAGRTSLAAGCRAPGPPYPGFDRPKHENLRIYPRLSH